MTEEFVRKTYSQFGEDCMLRFLLPEPTGFYVDVGAHDPWRYSNTALLFERGWRGINIDADVRAIDRFRSVRPNDVNLNLGVSAVAGSLELAIFADGALNTFDQDIARQYEERFGASRRIEVPVQRLESILAEHLPPETALDYLNIDCEGFDEHVLSSNDWTRFRPRVLTVEVDGFDIDHLGRHGSHAFLRRHNYVLRGQYWITSIFQAVEAL